MLPPILKTTHYLLSPYRKKDEERYFEMALDPEVIKFIGGITGSKEEEKERFKKIFEIYESDSGKWFWIWGIYCEDKLLAHLELKETVHTSQDELEIVYMVHPKERRKGIMSEVLQFLKEKHLDWQKAIVATISPENAASTALLEKWGIEKNEPLFAEDTSELYYKLFLIK